MILVILDAHCLGKNTIRTHTNSHNMQHGKPQAPYPVQQKHQNTNDREVSTDSVKSTAAVTES